jgi:hypothetical protein
MWISNAARIAVRLALGFALPLALAVAVGYRLGAVRAALAVGLAVAVVLGTILPPDDPLTLPEKLPEDRRGPLLARVDSYLEGKMKRYTLLYGVNGGIFAIGKLIQSGELAKFALGGLDHRTLAVGAILFTALMMYDIWLWGDLMRREFIGRLGFTRAGRAILLSIGGLLICGWALVLFGRG